MTKLARIFASSQSTAPWLSLVVLAGMSHALPNRSQFDPQAEIRQAEVTEAVRAAPRLIGPWVGEDEQVSPQAQELLRPNALLSRTYRRPGGPRIHVLLVHCSDARDMIGHYPPVCYPSSGWIAAPTEGPDDDRIVFAGRTLPVRVYRFRRLRDQGQDEQIRIFSAFVLPDGTVTPLIDDINQQSQRLAVSVQGVAQLQVVTSGRLDRAEAVEAASEVLRGMGDLFAALRIPQGENGDA